MNIKLDWSAGDATPPTAINVCIANLMGPELVLLLGHACPPASTVHMNGDEMQKYFDSNRLKVNPVHRFVLPLPAAKLLMETLQGTLGTSTPKRDGEEGS